MSDHLDWDSNTYYDVARTQDGSNQAREKDLRDQFRPLDTGGTIRDSCIAVDSKGRVEVIYLRNAISPERQVCNLCLILEAEAFGNNHLIG